MCACFREHSHPGRAPLRCHTSLALSYSRYRELHGQKLISDFGVAAPEQTTSHSPLSQWQAHPAHGREQDFGVIRDRRRSEAEAERSGRTSRLQGSLPLGIRELNPDMGIDEKLILRCTLFRLAQSSSIRFSSASPLCCGASMSRPLCRCTCSTIRMFSFSLKKITQMPVRSDRS